MRGEPHLGTDHRRVDDHRRILAGQLAHEDSDLMVTHPHRLGIELFEPRLVEAVGVGQGRPQLDAVQRPGHRVFRVRDAAAGRHQVDPARLDDEVGAEGVPVPDRPGEQPGHGLQPRVGVAGHAHIDVVGAEVVEEAPPADEADLARRQHAFHLQPVGVGQRDRQRIDDEGLHDLKPRRFVQQQR